ncbi:MAG: Ferrous iron transport protein [Frankiales bacterium]|nr:Ferrous iron transport protein [Frankiales bacterium]
MTRTVPAPSCHGDAPAAVLGGLPTVALVGSPNSGKSTLFNSLTGRSRTVGNWPGTTVEVGRARWQAGDAELELLDLPGASSLDGESPDEQLTRQLLRDVPDLQRPDLCVVVADAAHLARGLYLVAELREETGRVVVALTMRDVAASRGIEIDVDALGRALGATVVPIDPRQRQVEGLATACREALAAPRPPARSVSPLADDDEFAAAEERLSWVDAATGTAVRAGDGAVRTLSDKVDRWATSPVAGPLLFLAVMWAVFQVTTTVAAPLQNLLGSLFSGPVTSLVQGAFGLVGLRGSALDLFVVNGLVAGVGMLLTFVPLMALVFTLLALLEDSGYMARGAVVTDRLMRRIGLPGKAFLPLVVGFGCNVPAISATRIMGDARHRLMTALLVPFTSCSARLTVYVLLSATFFPDHAGSAVFVLYLMSILVVVGVGLGLRSTLWRSVGGERLVLDLPPYQRPTLHVTVAVAKMRVVAFLREATGLIVATVAAVWALQAVPVRGGASFGHVAPADSLFAAVCRAVAVVFAPLGFGDWHTTGALLTGFVAKEAVISSWAQTYAAADPTAGLAPDQLQSAVSGAFHASSGGATSAAVWAFLVFLLAYTPCVATLGAQRREIGLRWTAFSVALSLGVAYVLALAVFQVGRLL